MSAYTFRDGEAEKHCRGSMDGECNAADCPQLRDNEPHTTGRHCPFDHWCFYCGNDTAPALRTCEDC